MALFFITLQLALRLPGMALRYYFKRRGARARFKNELVASGLPQDVADELASSYPFKLGDMMRMAKSFSNE